MRRLWGTCLLALAACGTPQPDSARHLLLISIDTLRAAQLGTYGYSRDTSPNLDGFATRGAVFRNAFSPAPWTVPAHMSVFTGLEPVAHGVLDFPTSGRLGPDYVTLAEMLREQGFRTAAFTGGGFVSPGTGFARGFEQFVSRTRRFSGNIEATREWIARLGKDERFFVFLHGFDVHRPYRPPAPYSWKFLPRTEQLGAGRTLVADRLYPLAEDLIRVFQHHRGNVEAIRAEPTERERELLISLYDGEVGWVDHQLGELLAWLERRGVLRETLVVVLSDHGDEFWEHGRLDHTHSLYDELIRAAWFLAGPGVPQARIESPVSLTDVLPTLCELLAVPVAVPVQGVSRVGLLAPGSGAAPAEPVFSFLGFSAYPYRASAVRSGRWKLIRWSLAGMREVSREQLSRHHYTALFREEAEDFVELFDLVRDPGEHENVSQQHPELVTALQAALDARLQQSAGFRRAPGKPVELSPESREALRALGYLE